MNQERPSKAKRKTNAAYIKAGTMTSLANQMRSSFSQKYVVPARPSNKERPNIIEENQLIPQYPEVAANVHIRSTTPATQVVEEQVEERVQLDSTIPITNEQCEEQGPSIQRRNRGRTKMKSVHGQQ